MNALITQEWEVVDEQIVEDASRPIDWQDLVVIFGCVVVSFAWAAFVVLEVM